MDELQIPRRGNGLTRAIANGLYKVFGWQVSGQCPNLPKFLIIGAPHTSNWDFPLAMNFIFAQGIRIDFMAKHTLFWPPFHKFMRWLGGFPVNRGATHGLVGETVAEFNRRKQLVLAISPEGTREKVKRWRTGFYYIAHGAGVPIVPVQINFDHKTIGICDPFYPTGDLEKDLPLIQAAFVGIRGKNKDQF